MRTTSLVAALVLAFAADHVTAAEPAPVEARFRETVRPFVATYCVECHSGKAPKGDVDLRGDRGHITPLQGLGSN